MVVIDVDKSLSNSDVYDHRCIENIKKLYKWAGKGYDKHLYKEIIESTMV